MRGSRSVAPPVHLCYNDGSLGGLCEREARAKAVVVAPAKHYSATFPTRTTPE